MRQVLQSLRTGILETVEAPATAPSPGTALIRTRTTLISAGTERMLLEFGRAGWIDKARRQPDKVRMVLDKIKTDGLLSTVEAVRAKLDQPVTPGYSNAGVIIEVGAGVTDFRSGDRVVSNGPHAEVVSVPRNLCAGIPDSVSDDAAAFTVVAAIALQGIRLVQPTLGESVVVTGLGLIGLITVQLLRAHGCRVLGIDFDRNRLQLAQEFGAGVVDLSAGEDPLSAAERFSRGRGIDAVLITAATKSSEPVHQAALMCRKRGRVVLVGVTGLELSRDDFYKKELTLQVSCSYGPGRYDPAYEQGGQDYPYSHVRWTAQRNFEAVLDMMSDGRVNVTPFITHRFPFARALDAYKLLESDEFYLGIMIEYPRDLDGAELGQRRIVLRALEGAKSPSAKTSLGFIGAGGYAMKVLMPAFKKAGARLISVASKGGLSAAHAGRKFGFQEATTDADALLVDQRINTVVIATRHDTHSNFVCRALTAGKHVFVEKPLAQNPEQISDIEETVRSLAAPPLLMVGFNRRFAPQVQKIKSLLDSVKTPKCMVVTVNAGAIPADHWTQDPSTGGGRIVGEACHFIDLLRHLAGSPIVSVVASRQSRDTVTATVSFEDGSIGTVHYLATGHKSFPKERLEIFVGGRVLQLDNFRRLRGWGWPNFRSMNLWRQNKGTAACIAAFIGAVRSGGPSPIPFEELVEVAEATIHISAQTSLQ